MVESRAALRKSNIIFISFLCGRQAGLFIQSRRMDMNRSEIGTMLTEFVLGAVQVVMRYFGTTVPFYIVFTSPAYTIFPAVFRIRNHGSITAAK